MPVSSRQHHLSSRSRLMKYVQWARAMCAVAAVLVIVHAHSPRLLAQSTTDGRDWRPGRRSVQGAGARCDLTVRNVATNSTSETTSRRQRALFGDSSGARESTPSKCPSAGSRPTSATTSSSKSGARPIIDVRLGVAGQVETVQVVGADRRSSTSSKPTSRPTSTRRRSPTCRPTPGAGRPSR